MDELLSLVSLQRVQPCRHTRERDCRPLMCAIPQFAEFLLELLSGGGTLLIFPAKTGNCMSTIWKSIAWIVATTAFHGFALLHPATAQAGDFVWAFCDNCQTRAHFENAASTMQTQEGDAEIYVGNRSTGVVFLVSVTATRGPSVATSVPRSNGALQGRGSALSTGGYEPNARPGALFVHVNWSMPESEAFNSEFRVIVAAYKKEPMWTRYPEGNDGFDSFLGRDQEAVNVFVLGFYTQNNPSWAQQEISGNLLRSLANAFGASEGKGPAVCIVFKNGDSACFQLNVADPLNGTRYIAGTAKDIDGNTISESGGVGGEHAPTTTVRPESGNLVRFSTSGSAHYLVCSRVGGILLECYID